jgi:hypothetical protein
MSSLRTQLERIIDEFVAASLAAIKAAPGGGLDDVVPRLAVERAGANRRAARRTRRKGPRRS